MTGEGRPRGEECTRQTNVLNVQKHFCGGWFLVHHGKHARLRFGVLGKVDDDRGGVGLEHWIKIERET